MEYKDNLDKVPKLKPGVLICIIGWSMIMAALDNTIVLLANPKISVDPSFVPPGESIPTQDI